MRDLSIAEQCIPKECKDDLVSRRQVYRLKLASDNDWEFGQALMDIPSAEPERIVCDEVKLSKEEIQEAVDDAVKKIMVDMKNASTIEPERKMGKWIYHTYMPHKKYCSACGHDSPYDRMWNFCPSCGSYNGGE